MNRHHYQPGYRLLAVCLVLLSQSSCVMVGYSSRGGWSVWPGGFGLLMMLAVAVLIAVSLFRR